MKKNKTSLKETRKKCNRCGLKRGCSKNFLNCKAMDKNCFFCQKRNHFPGSQNCQKKKKLLHKIDLRKIEGCQTLRDWLKSNFLKLKGSPLPLDFSDRRIKKKFCNEKSMTCSSADDLTWIDSINKRISFIEEQTSNTENYTKLPYATKLFLSLYMLFSLKHISHGDFYEPPSSLWKTAEIDERQEKEYFFEDFVQMNTETESENTINEIGKLIKIYSDKFKQSINNEL